MQSNLQFFLTGGIMRLLFLKRIIRLAVLRYLLNERIRSLIIARISYRYLRAHCLLYVARS